MFRPRLEALEHRDVPSVDFSLSDGVLTIDGTIGNDHIAINDYGNGTLKIYNSAAFHTFGGVDEVKVSMGAGNDRVNHILQGNQTKSITYDISLGTGDDEFTSDIENKTVASALRLIVHGGIGNDDLYVSMNEVTKSGFYELWLDGEGGEDFIQALITNTDVSGGNADDNGVIIQSSFVVTLDGGSGRDTVRVVYSGENDGGITLKARGGTYDDAVSADLTFATGSSGTLFESVVDGGSGGDDLEFFVSKDLRDRIRLNATVIGGLGRDTATISADFVQYDDSTEYLYFV
jgi:hypothetical protein